MHFFALFSSCWLPWSQRRQVRLSSVNIENVIMSNQTTTRTATRTLPIKDLVHKTIAAHVRYKSLYISYSSFEKMNKKMKWATSTLSKKRERRLLIFRVSVWNWIRAIGGQNRYRQLRISLGKCSFLTRCRPRRYRRRCLSSLMFKSMLFFCPPCFFYCCFYCVTTGDEQQFSASLTTSFLRKKKHWLVSSKN